MQRAARLYRRTRPQSHRQSRGLGVRHGSDICAAPRTRTGSWPRAQRASTSDSPRLFERSERSERSKFSAGRESEHRREPLAQRGAAASERRRIPARGFVRPTASKAPNEHHRRRCAQGRGFGEHDLQRAQWPRRSHECRDADARGGGDHGAELPAQSRGATAQDRPDADVRPAGAEHRQPDVRDDRARDRDRGAGAARPPRDARQHLPQQGQGKRLLRRPAGARRAGRGGDFVAGRRAPLRGRGEARHGDGELRPPRHTGCGVGDRPRVGRQLRGRATGRAAPDRQGASAHRIRHRDRLHDEPQREGPRLLRRRRGGRRAPRCARDRRQHPQRLWRLGDGRRGPFARRAHRRAARAPDRRGGGERHAGLRPARRLSRCRPGGAARRVGDRHGRAVPVVADQPGSQLP